VTLIHVKMFYIYWIHPTKHVQVILEFYFILFIFYNYFVILYLIILY